MTNSKTIAWTVWMIASIFYAYQYILRVMPNIMLDDITSQFHMDAAVFGQYAGIYYIGYVLMHLPMGIMLDRYGPRKVMTACILLTVVGMMPIILSDHYIYPIIGRTLIGIGSSAAILGVFKIIRMTFAEERFTRMLSISVTIGLIGAIYGGGPVDNMTESLGFHVVVQIFAVVGVILATITYILVPEVKATKQDSVMKDIKTVFTNAQVIMTCVCAGLMVGPLEGFADVWGGSFLKLVYGLDESTASYLSSMIFMGMCFGAPVLGVIAEKTGRYLGSIIGAGIFMMATFLALVAGVMTESSILASFIVVGICCAYQILAIYKASTYVPEHVAGLTTAVANMIIMSFGYAFHSAIGFIINSFGGAHDAQAFVYGIAVIPITLAAGIFGFGILCYKDAETKGAQNVI